jgi:hypothetical protein
MEIVAIRTSRGVRVVADDREELSGTSGQAAIDREPIIFAQIGQISRDVTQRFDESGIDAQRLRNVSVDYRLHLGAAAEGAEPLRLFSHADSGESPGHSLECKGDQP